MSRAKAFTLIEVLVVAAILALLVAILLPSLAAARDRARITVCAAQMHSYGTGMTGYSADFKGHFPTARPGAGSWFWDLDLAMIDPMRRYGADRKYYYCPTAPALLRDDSFWYNEAEYRRNRPRLGDQGGFFHAGFGYVITGYAWFFYREGWYIDDSARIQDGYFVNRYEKHGWVRTVSHPRPAVTPVVVDPVIQRSGKWTDIGYHQAGSTSHVRGGVPTGGNELFVDGHVTWVQFSRMTLQSLWDATQWRW